MPYFQRSLTVAAFGVWIAAAHGAARADDYTPWPAERSATADRYPRHAFHQAADDDRPQPPDQHHFDSASARPLNAAAVNLDANAVPSELAGEASPFASKLVGSHRPLALAGPTDDSTARSRAADLPPLLTAAGSLGIVLGLFLLVAWVVRRGMPKPVPLLPAEAVEVLGRAALVGRQQVHLVRCGNKVLLLCATPTSVEALAEITDPLEVDRLSGICRQTSPHSVSSSFRQVFHQLGGNGRGRSSHLDSDEPDFDDVELSYPRGQELHA